MVAQPGIEPGTQGYSGLTASTLHAYVSKTISVVAKVFHIDGGKAKHDHFRRNPGAKTPHELWRENVRAVRLADITAARIKQWRDPVLGAVRDQGAKHDATRNTIISMLRCARSFFAKKNTEGLPHQPEERVHARSTCVVVFNSKKSPSLNGNFDQRFGETDAVHGR